MPRFNTTFIFHHLLLSFSHSFLPFLTDGLDVRWTRVWTLQEFLIPERLSFYCGNQNITRSDWRKATTKIRNYSMATGHPIDSLVGQQGFSNQWARRRLLAWYKHSTMGLFALMAYIGDHHATDDRDRVYAVLGICSDTDRAIVGEPDYDLSVEELYTRIVIAFMHQHKSLNILCHRALFTKPRPNLEETAPRPPTWVPDWRCWTDSASRPVPSMVSEPSRTEIGNFREIRDPKHGRVDTSLVYAASAGLPAEFSVSADKRRLTCKGVVVAVVDGLGPVGRYGPAGRLQGYSRSTLVQSTSGPNVRFSGPCSAPGQPTEGSTSYSIVESLVRSMSLDRAGRYLMWPADMDDYVYQLLDALHPLVLAEHELDVVEFIAANEELLVNGASLLEHLERAGQPPHKPGNYSRHSFWQAAEITVSERPWHCRLITTDRGHLGMAPGQAMKGDVVVVLIGCSVPVILRKSTGTDQYEVIGEAFMPGFMEGEAVEGNNEHLDITLV